jgi:hypothetical protein
MPPVERKATSVSRKLLTTSGHHARRVVAVATIGCVTATMLAATAGAATRSADRATRDSVTTTGRYGFNHPYAIAADHGDLWIANIKGDSVTEVKATTGAPVRVLRADRYKFHEPDAIAASGGHLFVLNRRGRVTEIEASDGSLVRVIHGAKYGFSRPTALLAHGGNIWVVNTTGDSLTEFSAADGSLVRAIHNPAGNSTRFNRPRAITAAGNHLWVVNQAGGSTKDADAGSLTELDATTGHALGHFAGAKLGLQVPEGVTYDGTHLWVSDSATDHVTELSRSGQLIQVITNQSHNANYGFDGPTAMVASAGMVYVLSPLSNSPMVTEINVANDANGDWFECNTNTPSPQWYNPTGMTTQGGHVWVVSPGTDPNTGEPSNVLVKLDTTPYDSAGDLHIKRFVNG